MNKMKKLGFVLALLLFIPMSALFSGCGNNATTSSTTANDILVANLIGGWRMIGEVGDIYEQVLILNADGTFVGGPIRSGDDQRLMYGTWLATDTTITILLTGGYGITENVMVPSVLKYKLENGQLLIASIEPATNSGTAQAPKWGIPNYVWQTLYKI